MKARATKEQINELSKKINDAAHEDYMIKCAMIDDIANDRNGRCPHCGGIKINDRIRDVSGTISLWGYSSISTKAINKCNECGHEWEKYQVGWNASPHQIIANDIESTIREIKHGKKVSRKLYQNMPISLFRRLYKTYCGSNYLTRIESLPSRRKLLKSGFIK